MKWFALLPLTLGIVSLVGWFYGIDELKAMPGAYSEVVSMKTSTALCCVGAAAAILLRGVNDNSRRVRAVRSAFSLGVFSIMLASLWGVFTDVSFGVEKLIVEEKAEAFQTVSPGQPSIGTMTGFLFVGVCGFVLHRQVSSWFHQVAGCLGVVGLCGYALDMPTLYYYVPEVSTAMAPNTCLAFIGLALAYLPTPSVRGKS